MVNIGDIKQLVRLTLSDIDMYSYEAEILLMGTGAVESRFQYLRQMKGGVARSFWQVEPATGYDNIKNWLNYRRKTLEKIAETCYMKADEITKFDKTDVGHCLERSISFAICMARIKYRRVPKRLPDADDNDGMGKYWLKYYNAGGKGSLRKWNEAQKLLII